MARYVANSRENLLYALSTFHLRCIALSRCRGSDLLPFAERPRCALRVLRDQHAPLGQRPRQKRHSADPERERLHIRRAFARPSFRPPTNERV
jgi:hypothetical protein